MIAMWLIVGWFFVAPLVLCAFEAEPPTPYEIDEWSESNEQR